MSLCHDQMAQKTFPFVRTEFVNANDSQFLILIVAVTTTKKKKDFEAKSGDA